MFPRIHFTRDPCFHDCSATLIANVAIANIYYINKDQIQVKRNEAIDTDVHMASPSSLQNIENRMKRS